jgi:6-phosphogluconolactonase (cycloisomerase 2 family)
MKFKKFGKALLMSALSAGVILSVTSCVQSYTVGYLYVTGTVTASTGSNGIVSGFKIDHNTGNLVPIIGLPVASGGANPVRAVLLTGSRFLYVLNQGVNGLGNASCFGVTGSNVCQNSNLTQFSVGGNGVLSAQPEPFYPQGLNSIRMVADTSGSFILVLDHDAPSVAVCQAALGNSVTSCGDISVFSVNSTTGRLSVVQNAQLSSQLGFPVTYFPVPANPIDFVLASGQLLTVSGTPATGDSVFPYTYNSSSGQLTNSSNSSQPMNTYQATAIVNGNGNIYLLDNEAPSPNPTGASSQILPFTLGNSGALQAQTGGIVADDSTLSNPIFLLVESKSKFLYVANQGNNVTGNNNSNSGLAAYFITNSPAFQLSFIAGEPFGLGSGPRCLVEDPSDQFIYSANSLDSTVSGLVVDPNSGVLVNLRVASSFALQGPATWCLVDGRTS